MEANTRKVYNPFSWNWKLVFETVRLYAETILVLLFIVNGLATFLILFNLVEANEFAKQLVGSVAFAFSAVGLIMITNRGVKQQSQVKKGRK